MTKKILLAGESWTSTATHIKGWDQFPSVTHHRGADDFLKVLAGPNFDFTYMLCHEAAESFPTSAEELAQYDAIILSDIGANTLLLPPAVWIQSKRFPNRLKAIRDYVLGGGGLIMVGGYYSFQGINGAARYCKTPVEAVLPVTMHPYDDRIEMPEGIEPVATASAQSHPVMAGLGGSLPYILGINEVMARPGADVLLSMPEEEGGHPLLVCGTAGKGRSAAWTTDIGPHWLPNDFLQAPMFRTMWLNLLGWVARSG
ncbi:glutamine amidotransferase [Bosea sp. NBC_00550]|uniref:glutamine amidotransferase n=1 Tax=Bosea sp. NBC_00550 TaxID=2969621 RepID=UPI003FA47925